MGKIVKIDLACGQRKQPGHLGVDIAKMPGVDIVCDLNKYPWPMDSNSVDEIFCSHYIEHVEDLVKFMNEIYRVLKMGGFVKFMAPYYNSIRCWQDPTHKNAISENAFFYYFKPWLDINGLNHYNIKANFMITYEFAPNQEFMAKNKQAYEGQAVQDWPSVGGVAVYFPLQWALKHLTNAVDDISVRCEKKPMDWNPNGEVKPVKKAKKK